MSQFELTGCDPFIENAVCILITINLHCETLCSRTSHTQADWDRGVSISLKVLVRMKPLVPVQTLRNSTFHILAIL